MAKVNNNTAPVLLDRRVVERNIKKGLLTREDYEKHLGSLTDVSALSEKVSATLHADEEEDSFGDG